MQRRPLRTIRLTLLRSMQIIMAGAVIIAVPIVGFSDDQAQSVPGLQKPVEIIVDRWGVSHIYATSEADLFFAQGYQAARARLFQFEMWRRQATGTVAEILGPGEVDRDIGARMLRFRGDLPAELKHYHSRGDTIIEAFVKGINAWIDQTETDPSLLPLEFRLLDIRPGRWTPEVVISRHQGLLHNLTQEIDLGRAVAIAGEKVVKDLVWFHPGRPSLQLDESITAEILQADILKYYKAARSPIQFKPEDVRSEFRRTDLGIRLQPSREALFSSGDQRINPVIRSQRMAADGVDIGSNNWVIGPRLSQSGSPIMANDPHRTVQIPSLRHFVHLVAPGWNVVGGGEPTLPGVSIGHNEHGAWGLTIFRIDAEDLYVYETHPDDPLKYRYGDSWESMQVVTEEILVKNQLPISYDFKFSRHGPIIFEDSEHRVACGLRAGWLEVGGAPYLASLRMNQATDWESFRRACFYSHIPGENMVWADRQGNIGWQAVGIAPQRRNWDGLVPVPGDGRYEWDGFLPISELPHVLNPAAGFWNSSNENVLPPDYAHRRAVAWTWADPFRGDRVREVLNSQNRFNVQDMVRLQLDEVSLPARALTSMIVECEALQATNEPILKAALHRLAGWNHVLARDSTAAAIYVMWQSRLLANVQQCIVPKEIEPLVTPLSIHRVIQWFKHPEERFGSDATTVLDQLIAKSLREAVDELTRRLGDDVALWKYGDPRFKHVSLSHPLAGAVNEALRKQLNLGPLDRGGDLYTVNNTGAADNQPSGATFRIIVDTNNWDDAIATNSPGQSSDPESPHYADLLIPWSQGQYFPLYYSRAKIESVQGHTIQLVPPLD